MTDEQAMAECIGARHAEDEIERLAADGFLSASLVEAIKETYRHMENLYRQAGEGRIVSGGLIAARERARELTQALINCELQNTDSANRRES